MDDLFWSLMKILYRRLGWGALIKLALLFALAMTSASGISSVLRDLKPAALAPYVLAALLAAWALHSLRLPGWLAGLLLLAGGGVGVLGVIGRLGRPVLQLALALGTIHPVRIEGLGWRLQAGALPAAWQALGSAFQGLAVRLGAWFSGMAGLQAVYDPLAAALAWSLCAWLLVAWMGWWALRRENVLLGLAPLVGLLAWALYFTRAQVHLLILALALGCTLQILTLHLEHTKRWQTAGLVAPDNQLALSLVILLIVGGLSTAAWLATSFPLERIERMVRALLTTEEPLAPLSESVGEALGLQVQTQPRDLFGRALQPTLPSQHLLTGGTELSETAVMWISLEGYAAMPPVAGPTVPEPPRYYWRSLAYNRYNGTGWYSDPTTTQAYQAETLLNRAGDEKISLGPYDRIVRQRVRVFRQGGGAVFYTGELLTVDQDYEVAWRRTAEPGDALGALVQENSYQAVSRFTDVSAESLRQAGSAYPDWVLARYLALPEELPQRVVDLALDLTATQPTPFDRALALETYLRSTFSYTLDIPTPPKDRDLVDYFLFDLQRGYCDYYASAMAVMARAAGLPSRLVTGYVGGKWDAQNGRITVTQAEAHSWVEVYFPGYGWMIFEPTAGRAALERKGSPAPGRAVPEDLLAGPTRISWQDWPARLEKALQENWVWVVLGAGLSFYLLAHADGWRLRARPPQATVAMVYRRVYQQAFHLGVQPGPGGTLREFSQRLVQTLEQLAASGWWQVDLARLADDVRGLSNLYEQALFSQRQLGKADQRRCIKIWQRMRPRFWLARLRMLRKERSVGNSLSQVVDPTA